MIGGTAGKKRAILYPIRVFSERFRLAESLHAESSMASIADELSDRLKRFAVRVIRFCRELPTDAITSVLAKQLVRSATGTSSNHRAARRGRSRAEFVAKLGVVVEEIDETVHWLELIDESGLLTARNAVEELHWLLQEATELRAIFVRSLSTARMNDRRM